MRCRLGETIIWYDGPMLAVFAADEGADLVAVAIDEVEIDGSRYMKYLAATTSPERIAQLIDDELAVRRIYTEPDGPLYTFVYTDDECELEMLASPPPEDWLPKRDTTRHPRAERTP